MLNKYLTENNLKEEELQNILPLEWFSINNYHIQTEILHEALDKEIMIEETKKYLKFINK